MNLHVHQNAEEANAAAAALLSSWLVQPGTKTVMVAAGNTPLELYRRVATQKLNLAHLRVFALDEYVGVPLEEQRNCANLMRDHVAKAWGIPDSQFHSVSSLPENALESVLQHERLIQQHGGLDVLILGLGQNGHLGFNEPGSDPDSTGRVLDLEKISVEANRKWFEGRYAPSQGVTVGLRTILAARRIIILAFGAHKTAAVHAMIQGPQSIDCPASWLQKHPQVEVFLDPAARGNKPVSLTTA